VLALRFSWVSLSFLIATSVTAIGFRVTEVSLQACTVCHHDIILELLTIIPTLTHYHGTICMYM